MINPVDFYNELKQNNIEFFTGIPDSLLKDICAVITEHSSESEHIIAANEGCAIGLAAGYHMATGKIPLVYMQNSGLGNSVNPLLSLIDKEVYNIPLLLLIGWRGKPGFKDEPQHIKQGRVTLPLLDAMEIPYEMVSQEFESVKKLLLDTYNYIKAQSSPFALIVQKGTFSNYRSGELHSNYILNRETVIKTIADSLEDNAVIVSTTGKTSRELFEYRSSAGNGHEKDFLTVGSMGHANQIALGISLFKKDRPIYCFDGDGAIIMHTGGLGIIGNLKPENFKHIIFNNGAHESVGGQPTIAHNINLKNIFCGFGYLDYYCVSNEKELKNIIPAFKKAKGPVVLEIKIKSGSRKDLGRPTKSPIENKINFMKYLNNDLANS